ncbi:MAG: hypothetical protein ACRDSS_03600 [Actinocrinis sp.]
MKPTTEQPVIDLGRPAQLVFTAAETSARLGGLISAYSLERRAARGEIGCTYIAGHLGFTEEHMRALIAEGERDPDNYGRAKAAA